MSSFDDGLRRIAYDRNHMPRAGEQMVALLRAGHHFVNTQNEDQLLDAVLNDAVSVLEGIKYPSDYATVELRDTLARIAAAADGCPGPW